MTEKIFTFRLPESLEKEMKEIVIAEGRDKSKILREILIKGIKEKKIDLAIKLFAEGRITSWKSARLSGVSLWEMIEEIKKRKVPLQYAQKELEEDLKAIR